MRPVVCFTLASLVLGLAIAAPLVVCLGIVGAAVLAFAGPGLDTSYLDRAPRERDVAPHAVVTSASTVDVDVDAVIRAIVATAIDAELRRVESQITRATASRHRTRAAQYRTQWADLAAQLWEVTA
jgi:hypothetical protein